MIQGESRKVILAFCCDMYVSKGTPNSLVFGKLSLVTASSKKSRMTLKLEETDNVFECVGREFPKFCDIFRNSGQISFLNLERILAQKIGRAHV